MSLGRREGRVLAVLGLVLLALGMRNPITGFAPVFAAIDADLHLGTVVLGIVGAVPLIAFAASGFVAPPLARALGIEKAILVGIAAAVLGQVVRALAGEAGAIVAGTLIATLGIGVVNVLLPPVVKRYFPERIGLISAIYLTLVGIGATTPGFLAVPLTDALGWRLPLALWATTLVLAAVPWLVLARAPRVATGPIEIVDPATAPVAVRVSRHPVAWGLVLVLIGSAAGGYSAGAWMPTILQQTLGFDPAQAAAQAAAAFVVAIPASLLVPPLATRARPAVAVVLGSVVAGVAGWMGLLLLPQIEPAVWATLIGLSTVTFPLVIVQLAARSATPQIAARLSGFVQGVAYLTTAAIVFGVGVLHSLSGGWAVPMIALAVLSLLPVPAVLLLRAPGRIGDRAPVTGRP